MSEMRLSDVVPGLGSAPQPDSGRGRRSEERKRAKRKKRRRRRAVLVMLVTFLVVGGGVAGAYLGLAPTVRSLMEPKDWTGPGTGELRVTIEPDSSLTAMGRVLAEAGVVKTEKAFVDATEGQPRARSIQAGTYTMRKQMSGAAAFALLIDPANRISLKVTVPEGKRGPETVAILAKELGIPAENFEAALREPASIGLPDALAKGTAEGWLFPSTYTFEPDVTAQEVLETMVDHAKDQLSDAGVPEAKWREVIIKASIAQKEARKTEDMGKVARVLDNRLAIGMKLQLDSTVSYGSGRFALATTAKERATDTPYNTYMRFGLPAGPIASPGRDAIDAVLNPTPGEWLFFVTTNPDTGETRFANTAAEHAENEKIWQAWNRAHGG